MVIKTILSKSAVVKINSDLLFLNKALVFANKHHFRLVVSGGYGLDGVLKTITRPHNDLDVIIYGQLSREKFIQEIKEFVLKHYPKGIISTESNKFLVSIDINAKGFGANIYFVETVDDPYNNINKIKLLDGKTQVNSETRFPLPVKANLNQIEFEAENPNLHLADILYKRKKDEQAKYTQDIQNLKGIINPRIVKLILAHY